MLVLSSKTFSVEVQLQIHTLLEGLLCSGSYFFLDEGKFNCVCY